MSSSFTQIKRHQLADSVIVDAKVDTNADIQQSKILDLPEDLNDIRAALKGYINGLNLTYLNNTSVRLESGSCRDNSNSKTLKLDNPIVLNVSNIGLGGLDTGTFTTGVNQWYWAWLIESDDKTTTSAIISASSTNPTLPIGYQSGKKRMVGPIGNSFSGIIKPFYQIGKNSDKEYIYQGQNYIALNVQPTYGIWTDANASAFIPTGIKSWGNFGIMLTLAGFPNNTGVGFQHAALRVKGSSASSITTVFSNVHMGSISVPYIDSDTSWGYLPTDNSGLVQYIRDGYDATEATNSQIIIWVNGFRVEL